MSQWVKVTFKQSRLFYIEPSFACIQVSLEALHFAYG